MFTPINKAAKVKEVIRFFINILSLVLNLKQHFGLESLPDAHLGAAKRQKKKSV